MDTFTITKNILNKYDVKAKKRFGQNFLIDDNILKNIQRVSDINENDLIIEIGPGLGNLTKYLLDKSKYVLLVEIDNKMINILNDRFIKYNNYTLLNEDILKINLDNIINSIEKDNNIKFENVKVVANLPYYITTPIIFKLLQEENRINEIIVMVQEEVANRMVSKNKNKDFGILTLMVKYFSKASIEFIVPKTSFIPIPDVTSAIIKLKKEKRYRVNNEELLFKLIHCSFAQRRKKLVNSLESTKFLNLDKSSLENLLESCGISKNVRAEELDLKDYIKLVENIKLN